VVCSDMDTSRTCGRCYRLHVRLGSSDVFTCPFCAYRAGRDDNAALNILRNVCTESLQGFNSDLHIFYRTRAVSRTRAAAML